NINAAWASDLEFNNFEVTVKVSSYLFYPKRFLSNPWNPPCPAALPLPTPSLLPFALATPCKDPVPFTPPVAEPEADPLAPPVALPVKPPVHPLNGFQAKFDLA
ncbi:hypothetical protein SNEBB_002476, partial [Seison nebaliae]